MKYHIMKYYLTIQIDELINPQNFKILLIRYSEKGRTIKKEN